MQFTLTELWGHMGLFARLVVIAMAIMSVISLIVVAERLLFYNKSKQDSLSFAEKLAPLLSKGDLDEAVSKAPKTNQGHLGRVLYAGLSAYKTAKGAAEEIEDTDEAREMVFESVARALDRQSQREVALLKRGNGWLGTVGATVPFIGLLGTVMGIVTAFQQMAASGSGGLGTVSAGIAEALITTAFGLLVAIPAVMSFNFLSAWVDGRAVDISESSNEMLDVVARQLHISFKKRHQKA
ncbi:MAG: MotA/TolQ/ExbB proton channel family protein [Labilithrix sp.]